MQTQTAITATDIVPMSRAGIIAAQNDAFRTVLGTARHGRAAIVGRVVTTRAISLLPREDLLAVIHAVRTADEFPAEDGPYREHDFGSCRLQLKDGLEQIFWKIDYYSNGRCQYGSEDPSDPARTFRVLTIMFASDY